MALSKRDKVILNDLLGWEEALSKADPTDLEAYYDRWIDRIFSVLPERMKAEFFAQLDSWLYHLHAMIQGSQFQLDARERILSNARIFDADITEIKDMKNIQSDKLFYLAQQQAARHRFYSVLQGSTSGTGDPLLLASDLPAMLVINLRCTQLIAMTYGYEVNTPFEMTVSLKVFHAGTMPPRLQKYVWDDLMKEIKAGEQTYFYEGPEKVSNAFWLEQPLKQLIKVLSIVLVQNKTVKGLPLLGLAIGAGTNYRLTKNVTDFAMKFYQYRHLQEKRGKEFEPKYRRT